MVGNVGGSGVPWSWGVDAIESGSSTLFMVSGDRNHGHSERESIIEGDILEYIGYVLDREGSQMPERGPGHSVARRRIVTAAIDDTVGHASCIPGRVRA